jgi:hypothetical protein
MLLTAGSTASPVLARGNTGEAMSEFMFRNLSVKLYPAEGDARRVCLDPSTIVNLCGMCTLQTCGICTQGCTGTVPVVNWCQLVGTTPIVCGADGPTGYQDAHTNLVIPAVGDLRADLASLKEVLRQQLAAVEVREQQVQAAAKPKSVEEIDQLKSQMQAAMAELDEQRAQLQGGTAAPGGAEGQG